MSLFRQCFEVSLISTIQLIYIVLLAILFRKLKLVDENFEKSFSKLITNLLLPAFIFCEIIQNFDINNYQLILQAALGCFMIMVTGLIFAFITGKILKMNNNDLSFLCAVLSSPHTTSIPLILIEVFFPVLEQIPFANLGPNAKERGLLYIALNSIFSNCWRWSVSYNLINPTEEKIAIDGFNEELLVKENSNKKTKKTLLEILKEIINTPIIVSIITILLCLNDNVRRALIEEGGFLEQSVVSVHRTIAKSFGFSVIFVLGLSFANLDFFSHKGQNISRKNYNTHFGKLEIAITTILKLIVMPLITCPVLIYFYRIGIFQDGVLVFLYLFMSAGPNAINLIIICHAKNTRQEEIALLMVVQYIAAAITLTFANSIFLYILLS